MRWIIVFLVWSGVCVAQPVNGPFVIDACNTPNQFGIAKVKVDDAGNAHIFYTKILSDGQALYYAEIRLTDGFVLRQPEVVFVDTARSIYLEDVSLDPDANPLALLRVESGRVHVAYLCSCRDSTWDADQILELHDGVSPTWGSLPSWIKSPRFIACGNEFVQLYLHAGSTFQIGNWGTEAVESPVVFFINASGIGQADFPEFYFGFQEYPLHLSHSVNSDSLYIWINNLGLWSGSSKYLVTSAGVYTAVDSILCCETSVAAFPLGLESFSQLCYEPSNEPRYKIVRHDTESCEERSVFFGELNVSACSAYQGNGFLIPTRDNQSIHITRLDSSGTQLYEDGTIVWEPLDTDFRTVSSDVSSQGLVAVAWTERTYAEQLMDQISIVSFGWETPLDYPTEPPFLPSDYKLSTYPNPFNSTVRIDYDLPRASDVSVSIHNTLGQQVATLFTGRADAGSHSLNWSPESASGVYFVKLVAGSFVTSRKILYVR